MTERELSSLIYIRARIDKIEERIAELEMDNGIGAVNMDGMPRGSTPGDPTARLATARATLHEQLVTLRATLKEKELEIQEYIESVENEDIKLIMQLRFVELMNWYEIAAEMEEITGKWADRTTLSKKMRKYLREHAE